MLKRISRALSTRLPKCVNSLKAQAENGRNIVGQQHVTLLGPTYVASVYMEPQQCLAMLALVAYSLKPVKL